MVTIQIHEDQVPAYIAEVQKRLDGLESKMESEQKVMSGLINQKENIILAITQCEIRMNNLDVEIQKMEDALNNPK